MQLYSLSAGSVKIIGYMSISPEAAPTFLEMFEADDGRLYPMSLPEDKDAQ